MLVEQLLAASLPLTGHRPPLKPMTTHSPSSSTIPVINNATRQLCRMFSLFQPLRLLGFASLAQPKLAMKADTEAALDGILIYFSSESACGNYLDVSFYTLDRKGHTLLVGSIRLLKSYAGTRHKLKADGIKELSSYKPVNALRALGVILVPSLCLSALATELGHRRQPRLVNFYDYRVLTTLFGFLRYFAPRRINASRRVLLDQEEYQITHIGRGAFATVSRVLYKPTGDVRVIKRITFDDLGLAKYLAQAEIEALETMAGNIWFPPLLNHFMDGDEFIVTMPFYKRGDMAGLIQHKGFLGRTIARFYCAQLVLAIQCLHKRGIIHRDIKPDNIFFDQDGHLILADLGLAENIATVDGGEETITTKFSIWVEARIKGGDDFPLLWIDGNNPLGVREVAGTYWYTAPEVFRRERYSFGVDYWSVAVIYYELVTGHIPFNNFRPYPENKWPVLDFRVKPGQLKDVELWEEEAIMELLASNVIDRPKTLTEIKRSLLFSGINWERMARREIYPPILPQPLVEG